MCLRPIEASRACPKPLTEGSGSGEPKEGFCALDALPKLPDMPSKYTR